MSDKNFTIMSLDEGAAAEELNRCIRDAAIDVRERGHILKPRKVTFELEMVPQDGGFLKISAKSKITLPPNTPRKTLCSLPDEAGNMRDLNAMGTGQKSLPREDLFPDDLHITFQEEEVVGGNQQ